MYFHPTVIRLGIKHMGTQDTDMLSFRKKVNIRMKVSGHAVTASAWATGPWQTSSVLLCGKRKRRSKNGQLPWPLRPLPRDRQNIALICTLDSQWKTVESYHLVQPIRDSVKNSHCFYKDDGWLTNTGVELKALRKFCDTVRSLAGRVAS